MRERSIWAQQVPRSLRVRQIGAAARYNGIVPFSGELGVQAELGLHIHIQRQLQKNLTPFTRF
jgi:hypothetical protein